MGFIRSIGKLVGWQDPESASNPKSIWYMDMKFWEAADSMANAPPWLVFPNHPEPEEIVLTGRQGNNELYFDTWWEFWEGKTPEARLCYLQEHHAPPAWLEYLKPGGDRDYMQKMIRDTLPGN